MNSNQLNPNEYSPFYKSYIDELNNVELIDGLENSITKLLKTIEPLSEEKFNFSYAPEKWTIKELLQHLIDTERIMCYRALRFSRNDAAELQGFDENWYVTYSNANNRTGKSLLKELKIVRKSTLLFFKNLKPEALLLTGTANKNDISVRSLGFIIAGHQLHHLNILKERYL